MINTQVLSSVTEELNKLKRDPQVISIIKPGMTVWS